ncbi:MAG: phosphoadenosine phosphosulfate reductase family protein [archaeon]|nr:phosphoadenosine phosphosulfate reductase family protein [archaeon]
MTAIRLGKNHLRWCYHCNFPILESKLCPICENDTYEVKVTPPGEIRPAFDHDINLIRKIVDSQYGDGVGLLIIPENHVVLLNKMPSLDRMDEIIIDGKPIASMRFDLGRGWVFINRMQSAMRMAPAMKKGYVVCDSTTVVFIQNSRNLMAPGVIYTSPDVKEGDEVVIVTPNRNVVGTGIAKMSATEMIEASRGVAVKTKWTKPEKLVLSETCHTWDEVIEANKNVIKKRVSEATSFIRKNIESVNVPAVVSFSGGKDSLATLLLTIDAGYNLPVLFINTGLEFNETVKHVREVTKRHNLKLIEEAASADVFFNNLAQFGPPAKDFRWCCKTNKLSPTVKAINKNFPNGVLSFIGQRKYESESRHNKPRIWNNPWIPGQIGASPIQSWNSIHVWMYLFLKKEPYNVLYTQGLDRIGCFLCPASDIAEFDIASGRSSKYSQWNKYLDDYIKLKNLPEEWKEYGLWRWKRIPSSVKEEVNRISGKDILKSTTQINSSETDNLSINIQEGYSPCVIGYSIEAALSRSINIDRLSNFMHILGRTIKKDSDGQWASVNYITIYKEGAIVSKANVKDDARQNINKLFNLVIRSEKCVGCGLCVSRCKQKALYMKNGKVEIEYSKCIRCQDCFGPCPAVNFNK